MSNLLDAILYDETYPFTVEDALLDAERIDHRHSWRDFVDDYDDRRN